MLSEKSVKEIREHLDNCENPVFFYDSDADGLASFVLLAKYIGKGKGIVVKNFREQLEMYLSKIRHLGADYVFVLDKPQLTQEFIDGVNEMNLPLIVIDHHDVPKLDNLEFYYNTFYESGKNESVAELCYSITQQKKDMWVAAVGAVADVRMPGFFKEFEKENPELVDCKYEEAFDIRYKCKLGKLIDIFNFGLKNTTTNVVKFQKFLIDAQFPSEVLEENAKTKVLLEKYNQINEIIDKLVIKAEKKIDHEKKFLWFTYGGGMSVSQHFADKLMYKNPGVVLVIGYTQEKAMVKFSFRGKPQNVQKLVLNSIKGLEGAKGGGHKHSSGAIVPSDKVEEFKDKVIANLE